MGLELELRLRGVRAERQGVTTGRDVLIVNDVQTHACKISTGSSTKTVKGGPFVGVLRTRIDPMPPGPEQRIRHQESPTRGFLGAYREAP